MIGFTCGSFDLLHTGHVLMFEECKSKCDYLIVGLQTDPSIDRSYKRKPTQSIYERWVQLSAIKYIDEIVPYDTEQSLSDMLESIEIDIRFVGNDHKGKHFTGSYLPIDIYYNKREHRFSTTEILERIKNGNNSDTLL
jgi:glycerol-3-phosphate cytidylyltransferase